MGGAQAENEKGSPPGTFLGAVLPLCNELEWELLTTAACSCCGAVLANQKWYWIN